MSPRWTIMLVLFAVVVPFARAGQLTLGTQLNTWSTNYVVTTGGTEFLIPFTFNANLDQGLGVYGRTQFVAGSYSPSIDGSETTDLSGLSDSIAGFEVRFNSFSVPALLDLSFNIPTGDPTWENKQINANIPTEFLDSRYQGRGFGVNAMYGLSFPSGSTELGMALGYSYQGTYNPGSLPGIPSGDVKLGDNFFVGLSHATSFSSDQKQFIRISGFFFLPTQVNGVNIYQQGVNLNGSYSWQDPKGLSFDLGAQYYLSSQRPDPANAGLLASETNAFWAPRFYFTPSYSFGDITLAGSLKYILPNNYPLGDAFYEGGGLLAGIEPSAKLPLDATSNLRLSAGYDLILHHNGGQAADLSYVEAYYNLFTFGATYEVKL